MPDTVWTHSAPLQGTQTIITDDGVVVTDTSRPDWVKLPESLKDIGGAKIRVHKSVRFDHYPSPETGEWVDEEAVWHLLELVVDQMPIVVIECAAGWLTIQTTWDTYSLVSRGG
tara:strand:- start:1150 stop:1491 length:342 start_codon:yes stop_codon:yes gene_type:complete